MDPEFATPIRGSSLPPSCGCAEARARLHEGENTANTQGINREVKEVTSDKSKKSPLQGTRLSCKFNMLALDKIHIASTGSFPHIKEVDESKLDMACDLYRGNNFLKRLIILHGGRFHNSITNSTNFLLVGDLPVKATIEKAMSKGVHQVNYETIQCIIYRKLSISEALYIPSLGTSAVTQVLGPPAIQQEAEMPNNEETGTARIMWSNLKTKKGKEPTKPLDQSALVAHSKVICPRGVLDLARLRQNKSHPSTTARFV